MRGSVALALLWAGCVHTPPHPPILGQWAVTTARREQMTRDGVYCAWEAESLSFADRPIWTADPPEGENWCHAAGEAARTVDVLAQDGPFLSTRLVEDA